MIWLAAAVVMAQAPSIDLARATVVSPPGATEAEKHAARELAHYLGELTGRRIPLKNSVDPVSIIVGPGALSKKFFGEVQTELLGNEEFVWKAKGSKMLIAGGRPRGTLYGVYRFLHENGVRWWTPWATHVPSRPSLLIENGYKRKEKPFFESRDPFWFHAFDGDWSARNCTNGFRARLDERRGGNLKYQGFVHTFFELAPPDRHFDEHPEWYSEIGGKRIRDGQLCTTNPELRAHIVRRVRNSLRRNPDANIVSVSQNDWYRPCECPTCKAIDDAEGSHAGTMVALANYVAEQIEAEFPNAAIDTLAYQYTRKAPKTIRPRPNVIIRLCSIECNFAQPLDHPSNAAFARDIQDWSRLTQRLYVWDYTTDFPNYVMPFPNWFVLGPNVRFFANNGVKGLFEQGAYQSFGAEMAELRAWVLGQLLWNPFQDDKKLIDEFLQGYYGPAAGSIREYMDLMAESARDHNMLIWTPPSADFFNFDNLRRAEELWESAESKVAGNPDLLWRVRQGRLPVHYVWLSRWNSLRRQSSRLGARWPLPESRKAVADQWLALATGPGPTGWAAITHMNEAGLTPQKWAEQFATDPPPYRPLPTRLSNPPLPADLEAGEFVDAQDHLFRLFGEGDMSDLREDPSASDRIACWMPGTHHEWAAQLRLDRLPQKLQSGKWKVYVVARVQPKAGAKPDSPAFTAGLYDDQKRSTYGHISTSIGEANSGYKSFLLGEFELPSNLYVWVAPVSGGAVDAVWVDRVLFLRN